MTGEALTGYVRQNAGVDGRGARIDQQVIETLREASMGSIDGKPIFRNALFRGASVKEGTSFEGVAFQGVADFANCVFEGDVSFDKSWFGEEAVFTGARFQSGASFQDADFLDDAYFGARFMPRHPSSGEATAAEPGLEEAIFEAACSFATTRFHKHAWFENLSFNVADFEECSFGGGAYFDSSDFGEAHFGLSTFGSTVLFTDCNFEDEASFAECVFEGAVYFTVATFLPDCYFNDSVFKHDVVFAGSLFHLAAVFNASTFERRPNFDDLLVGDLSLDDCRFVQGATIGPALILRNLTLEGAYFARASRVEANANGVVLDSVVTAAPLEVRLNRAVIVVRNMSLGGHMSISDSSHKWPDVRIPSFTETLDGGWQFILAKVIDLRGTDMTNVSIDRADLTNCRFYGATNLDQIGIGETAVFPHSPHKANRRSRTLPTRRWTRRQTIGEEHEWRCSRTPEWCLQTQRRPGRFGPLDAPTRTADEVAALYRALRKAREDRRNEPGAADFYYGEMEMRRLAGRSPPERIILGLYWLTSGYGLRAWRAATGLAVVLLVSALVLWSAGTRGEIDFGETLLRSAEFSLGLFQAPLRVGLTPLGEIVRIVLRLLGPAFLALWILAIRGKVRR